MPAELDPREIAAAHVGFPRERLLTQATGCPQSLELLRQGVHAGHIVTDLAQPVNGTFAAFRGQLWPITGHWTPGRTSGWCRSQMARNGGWPWGHPVQGGVLHGVGRIRGLMPSRFKFARCLV